MHKQKFFPPMAGMREQVCRRVYQTKPTNQPETELSEISENFVRTRAEYFDNK